MIIKNKDPKVSIIIPLHVICERFFSDLLKFDDLNYDNYEIIVVSDKKIKLPKLKSKTRLFLTGKRNTGPAEKRDIAIKKASGSICAFIDDDAYPDKDWIKNAIVHFYHPHIAAVGGPGLTPKEDDYWEQLTGLVYSSFFCGGFARYRFVMGKMQFIDDYPAYNLIVKKSILNKIGGYGTHFYGGEDTFLCLKIITEGWKIIYDPDVVVYHHRRPLFLPYLKQIANIGKHRGYFAKEYPETSLRLMYFFPTILSFGFISLSIFVLFRQEYRILYIYSIFVFYLFGTFSVLKKTSMTNALIASLGILLTHMVYGVYFPYGLLTNEIKK